MNLFTEPGPFTTAEVAAACRCSQRFVQKAIQTGGLEARRLGRRVFRIPATAARRFAEGLGAGPSEGSVGAVRTVREMRNVRIAGR